MKTEKPVNKKILSFAIFLLFIATSFSVSGVDNSIEEYINENLTLTDNIVLKDTSIELEVEELRKQGEREGWTFTVGKTSASEYSVDQLCGLNFPENATITTESDNALGGLSSSYSSFDWREEAGWLTVKSQGNCGSCWAFATVGALEYSILINDGEEVDLSEQWLLNCNKEGYSCAGGWFAHQYHLADSNPWKSTDRCGGCGAVLESDMPYKGYKTGCACSEYLVHPYAIDSWGSLAGIGITPSVSSMKNAIREYGPISVAVYADSAFKYYTGGVFNSCNDGNPNHAVVLVGWDDNDRCWILLNSWGPRWGENGYMRIKYGCRHIGNSATYVVYTGASGSGPLGSKIEIAYPKDSEQISGKIKITGTASALETEEIQRVKVKIGDTGWRTAIGTEFWTCEWDTTEVENGLQVIFARALIAGSDAPIDNIRVTVRNNDYNVSQNELPVADAGGPYEGYAGKPIQFDGSGSYDLDGEIVKYEWKFSDKVSGGNVVGIKPTFIFKEPGNYKAELTVTDNNESNHTDSAEVMIRESATHSNHPPNKPFNPNPKDGETDVGLNLILIVEVSDPDEDDVNVSFYFDGELVGIDEEVPSGDHASIDLEGLLAYDTTYEWYAVADDGEYYQESDVFAFKTKERSVDDKVVVEITKPLENNIYLLNSHLKESIFTIILGAINIQVNISVLEENDVENISFYLNDEEVFSTKFDSSVDRYNWSWNKKAIGFYTIEVAAVDDAGDKIASDSVDVLVFSTGI